MIKKARILKSFFQNIFSEVYVEFFFQKSYIELPCNEKASTLKKIFNFSESIN